MLEIFHGNKDRFSTLVPAKRLDEAMDVLYRGSIGSLEAITKPSGSPSRMQAGLLYHARTSLWHPALFYSQYWLSMHDPWG
jgi:hypothetical protein